RSALGAGDGLRDRGQPRLYDEGVRPDDLDDREQGAGSGSIRDRRWRAVGGSYELFLLRGRPVLPPPLPKQSREQLAAHARRRRGKTAARRQSRRCRMRARLVHRHDGEAFPNSQFIGYDFHPSSIEQAASYAREHGVTANTRFEVATAKGYPGKDFDLVAF